MRAPSSTSTFKTPRLQLRRLRSGDEKFLASLDSDLLVMQYIHSGPFSFLRALRHAELEVKTVGAYWQMGKWMVELRDGPAIGWVQLFKFSSAQRDDIAIGYEFAPAYWGQGYATEANRRMLQYALRTLELDRVLALARPENLRSVRVLEKLGFQKIGQRRDAGGNQCNLYRVLPEDCI